MWTYREVKSEQLTHFVPCFHSPGQNKIHFASNMKKKDSLVLFIVFGSTLYKVKLTVLICLAKK